MIEIINQSREIINASIIRKACQKLFLYFALDQNKLVEIIFVSPAKIKKLNFEYRLQNKVTDVLSFSVPTIPNSKFPQIFGSIIICPNYIQKKYPDDIQNYLPYILHGFIHLAGLDHASSSDQKIFAHQTNLLSQKLNIKSLFKIYD